MIDSVKFASTAEVVAHVEASLARATAPEWEWRASAEDRELLSWVVFPAGDEPRWNNRWVVYAAPSGEFFLVLHSNTKRGLWSLDHCMQNAAFISRFTLDGPKTLSLLLRRLFETTEPNCWDPT